MPTIQLDKNPTDPYNSEDDLEETPKRLCIGCGEPLPDDFLYDLCDDCTTTKACHHNIPYTELCSQCCTDSDFAYDAMREKGWR